MCLWAYLVSLPDRHCRLEQPKPLAKTSFTMIQFPDFVPDFAAAENVSCFPSCPGHDLALPNFSLQAHDFIHESRLSRHFHSKVGSAFYGANFQTLMAFRPFSIISKPSLFPEIVSNLIVSYHTLSLWKNQVVLEGAFWKHFFWILQNQVFLNSAVFPFFSFQKQVFNIIDRNKPAFPKLFKTNSSAEIRKTEKWCNGGHGKNPWDPWEKNGKTNG